MPRKSKSPYSYASSKDEAKYMAKSLTRASKGTQKYSVGKRRGDWAIIKKSSKIDNPSLEKWIAAHAIRIRKVGKRVLLDILK